MRCTGTGPMAEAPVPAARGIWRGYWAGGKRSAKVTRLHVIRDKPVRQHHSIGAPRPSHETWCGQGVNQHQHSEPVILDPLPSRPPEGLAWCPKCVGHLAEWYGLLDEVADSLAAYDPELVS